MLSSARLKEIVSEARPYIERQMDDAAVIAGFRDVVAAEGGDWSALKALIKAQIKDERDDSGEGKHVQKILDKAEFSSGYADMLGWSNMNEQNFSAGTDNDPETGEINWLNSEPITEPQRSPAAQMPPEESVQTDPLSDGAETSLAGAEGIADRQPHSPETADETQATTPLPEDHGQRAAVSIAQEHRPAEANGLVKEPSEPEGSGGVQDRCVSTPPPHSQSSGLHDGPLQAGSASALDKSGDSATGAEASVARILNTRCLKAQHGEFCKFADKAYSCSGCIQADLQAKERVA